MAGIWAPRPAIAIAFEEKRRAGLDEVTHKFLRQRNGLVGVAGHQECCISDRCADVVKQTSWVRLSVAGCSAVGSCLLARA
jgi:hypothetical protein